MLDGENESYIFNTLALKKDKNMPKKKLRLDGIFKYS